MRVDLVAVDGTKMQANASKDANRLRDELAQEVAGWLRDADDVDAAEDAQVDGSRREKVGREDRRQRIREALRQAQADTTGNQRVRRNITDPDSRLMKVRQGFLLGYNGQAMATVDLVVIAAELSMNPIDRNELLPVIETARKTLEAANVDATIGVVVADAGYWSQHNATAEVECELLIATTTADKQPQSRAKAASERSRSGLSPTLTKRGSGGGGPHGDTSRVAGAVAVSNRWIWRSRALTSSRRARARSEHGGADGTRC